MLFEGQTINLDTQHGGHADIGSRLRPGGRSAVSVSAIQRRSLAVGPNVTRAW